MCATKFLLKGAYHSSKTQFSVKLDVYLTEETLYLRYHPE